MSVLREEIKTLDLPAYIGVKYEYGKRKKLNSEYKTNLVEHTFVPSMTAVPYNTAVRMKTQAESVVSKSKTCLRKLQ